VLPNAPDMPRAELGMSLIIVDLCGTLVKENTTRGFVEWLPVRGWRRAVAKLGLSHVVSRLSARIGWDISRKLLIFSLRGLTRDYLYAEAGRYVHMSLTRLSNAEVVSAVLKAKRNGNVVYLTTASLDPIAWAVVSQLQLDGLISSCLKYDRAGKCVGILEVDVTGNKWLHAWSTIPRDKMNGFTVYTDNPEDTDLIRHSTATYFVGNPSQLRSTSEIDLKKIKFIAKT
jgi:phosphoserine phosphatase